MDESQLGSTKNLGVTKKFRANNNFRANAIRMKKSLAGAYYERPSPPVAVTINHRICARSGRGADWVVPPTIIFDF